MSLKNNNRRSLSTKIRSKINTTINTTIFETVDKTNIDKYPSIERKHKNILDAN